MYDPVGFYRAEGLFASDAISISEVGVRVTCTRQEASGEENTLRCCGHPCLRKMMRSAEKGTWCIGDVFRMITMPQFSLPAEVEDLGV